MSGENGQFLIHCIALDTPNDETIAAMAEANEIASGKRKAKSYKNANAMIKDILNE